MEDKENDIEEFMCVVCHIVPAEDFRNTCMWCDEPSDNVDN
jgi:hypothetical protein